MRPTNEERWQKFAEFVNWAAGETATPPEFPPREPPPAKPRIFVRCGVCRESKPPLLQMGTGRNQEYICSNPYCLASAGIGLSEEEAYAKWQELMFAPVRVKDLETSYAEAIQERDRLREQSETRRRAGVLGAAENLKLTEELGAAQAKVKDLEAALDRCRRERDARQQEATNLAKALRNIADACNECISCSELQEMARQALDGEEVPDREPCDSCALEAAQAKVKELEERLAELEAERDSEVAAMNRWRDQTARYARDLAIERARVKELETLLADAHNERDQARDKLARINGETRLLDAILGDEEGSVDYAIGKLAAEREELAANKQAWPRRFVARGDAGVECPGVVWEDGTVSIATCPARTFPDLSSFLRCAWTLLHWIDKPPEEPKP